MKSKEIKSMVFKSATLAENFEHIEKFNEICYTKKISDYDRRKIIELTRNKSMTTSYSFYEYLNIALEKYLNERN